MNRTELSRWAKLLVPGALILQMESCIPIEFLELLQTAFLGVTAAGALAIINNI